MAQPFFDALLHDFFPLKRKLIRSIHQPRLPGLISPEYQLSASKITAATTNTVPEPDNTPSMAETTMVPVIAALFSFFLAPISCPLLTFMGEP